MRLIRMIHSPCTILNFDRDTHTTIHTMLHTYSPQNIPSSIYLGILGISSIITTFN